MGRKKLEIIVSKKKTDFALFKNIFLINRCLRSARGFYGKKAILGRKIYI